MRRTPSLSLLPVFILSFAMLVTGCSDEPGTGGPPPPDPNRTLWTVRTNGTGDFSDIQDAVNVATNGDTILIGPGHYSGLHQAVVDGVPRIAIFIVIAKSLTIIGEAGPDSTVVGDVSATDYAIVCNASAGRISGLEVRGGGNAGVFLFRSSVFFTGNRVTDATTAVECKQGSPTVASNTLTGNLDGILATATTLTTNENRIEESQGRGIACTQGTTATLVADEIVGSDQAGLSVTESEATASRLLIAEGSYSAVLLHAAQLTISESTIAANSGYGFVLTGSSTLEADHVIVALSQLCAVQVTSGTAHFACSDDWMNGEGIGAPCALLTGEDNIELDPVFCGVGSGDYSLDADSPCAPANSGACGQIGAFSVGCP